MHSALAASLDATIAETDFSGVVHLSRGGSVLYERAAGFADRAHQIQNTMDTQFGLASGSKVFTALVVMSLVAEGALTLDTTARTVLGDKLPLIDPAVTVGQLLAHTSGIGDYLDEDLLPDISDYAMPVPVQQLATTADFLVVLDGHPMKFTPGERFEYCNGGFVVLALIAELASGSTFHDLVAQRVCDRAGMSATAYLRTDQLPGSAATGYVPDGDGDGWRTNYFHLPIRGNGDGGAYSTVADFSRFWAALFAGAILPLPLVEEMVRGHSDIPSQSRRYGLGFWLRGDRDTVISTGYDAGASFRSAFDRASALTYTVISNTSEGVWPLTRSLDGAFPQLVAS